MPLPHVAIHHVGDVIDTLLDAAKRHQSTRHPILDRHIGDPRQQRDHGDTAVGLCLQNDQRHALSVGRKHEHVMIPHRGGDGRRRLHAHHRHEIAHPLLGKKLRQSPPVRAISNHRKRHRQTAGPAGCEDHRQSENALVRVDQPADEEQPQRQFPGTAGLPLGRRGQFDAVVDADHGLRRKAG